MLVSKNSRDTSIGNVGDVFSDFTYGHSNDVLFDENRLIYIIPIVFILFLLIKKGKK